MKKFRKNILINLFLTFLVTSCSSIRHHVTDEISGRPLWKNPSDLKTSMKLPRSGVIDTHCHLAGANKDNYVHPDMVDKSFFNFFNSTKGEVLIKSMGIDDLSRAEEESVARLVSLLKNLPFSYKSFIFAMAATYDESSGEKNLEKTGLEVSNDYILKVAKKHKDIFIPVGSVHPFQKNVAEEMSYLAKNQVKFIKWLPNSMHFYPNHPKVEYFFTLLKKYQMILITHVGDEHALSGGGIENEMGNPMLYEHLLKKFPQVKIIFAHMGSEGESLVGNKKIDNFQLVLNLLRKYPNAYADISAFSSAYKRIKHLPEILNPENLALHNKLLFGTDYPLVSVKYLVWKTLDGLEEMQLLKTSEVKELKEIYFYNPLLTSVLTMKLMNHKGVRFKEAVFYKNAYQLLMD